MTSPQLPATAARTNADAGTAPLRVSVIIANYNYVDYVGAAIASALDLDWLDIEVIVVDDGSTDGSQDVIRRFSDDRRVTILLQENATQRVARNRGYELSTGDMIVHLDSDDVLHPDLIRRVATVWRSGITKVQVQMETIDGSGRPTGTVFPRWHFAPSPAQLTHWVLTTTAHPTPPGSGNIYSRAFLDRIFPLDDWCGPDTDSACLIAAPLLGDVITIPEPLVGYRVHGENTSNMLSTPDKFARAVERGRARYLYGQSLLSNDSPDERPLRRSRELLQFRIAAARRTPEERPLPGDGRGRMLIDVVRNLAMPGPERVRERLIIAAWCLVVLLSPRLLAERLIRLRYARQ